MKLIITGGLSGSGKSTFSRNLVKQDPSFVRVNRDDLRRQIMGEIPKDYYKGKIKETENHITALEYQQIRYWLKHGKNVIVDNTHLQRKYIDKLILYFGEIADIEFKIFDIPLEICIERIKLRDGDVDINYLYKQKVAFIKISKEFHNGHLLPRRRNYISLITERPCIIVDLDGTLADCSGIRSPYDGENLCNDRLIEPVANLIKGVINSYHIPNLEIIYMSGREDKWRELTLKWLEKHNLLIGQGNYTRLFMRASGDMRDDAIVKRELYMENIFNKFDVNCVIDDRIRVVWMWEDLGLFVINVNQGNRWF